MRWITRLYVPLLLASATLIEFVILPWFFVRVLGREVAPFAFEYLFVFRFVPGLVLVAGCAQFLVLREKKCPTKRVITGAFVLGLGIVLVVLFLTFPAERGAP